MEIVLELIPTSFDEGRACLFDYDMVEDKSENRRIAENKDGMARELV